MTMTTAAAPARPRRAMDSLTQRYLVLVGLIVIASVGFGIANENFYSLANVGILHRSIAVLLLVSMGMTFTMLTGVITLTATGSAPLGFAAAIAAGMVIGAINGVYQRDEGEIRIDGQAVEIAAPADAGLHGIGMIHQELSLINELTVAANIFPGREIRRGRTPFLDKGEMARQVRAQVGRFGLSLDPDKPVRELNSGEKQIVEIIRALMSDAWLIVMDEQTSALSEEDKEMLFDFIRRTKAEGIAIIYISHHMPEIVSIAEQVAVMRDGRIVLPGRTGETSEGLVMKSMTEAELDQFVKPHKQIAGEVVLSIERLTSAEKYEGVSLDVHRGEIVVLTGLRGCGPCQGGLWAGPGLHGAGALFGRGPDTGPRPVGGGAAGHGTGDGKPRQERHPPGAVGAGQHRAALP